ncbi:MAG: hypothetical protein FRX49_10668 [Trebouxia sp. A1-2]|nr:MAG: hypothetical protein FRX49_10668 [Trebouxia sp. A1-2]
MSAEKEQIAPQALVSELSPTPQALHHQNPHCPNLPFGVYWEDLQWRTGMTKVREAFHWSKSIDDQVRQCPTYKFSAL